MYATEFQSRSCEPIAQYSGAATAQNLFKESGSKSASTVPTVLIESNTLLREGLVACLNSTHFRVIASDSSLEAIPSSLDDHPELIMVGGSDVAVVANIIRGCSERYLAARRVALGNLHAEHYMSLLKAGAHACLRSDITVEALCTSLKLVMLRASFICQPEAPFTPVANRRNGHIAGIPASKDFDLNGVSHGLSKTEIAVLRCLVEADTNKVIARKLRIAEATVKAHIMSIRRKIGAVNRTQAALWAMTNLDTGAKSEEARKHT